MDQKIEKIINEVPSYWTKDLIIRFLYKKLAPCFHRDLEFYLASEEEKIKQVKAGFINRFPAVTCGTLADFYVDLFENFDISAKKVIASNGKIPLYALVVEGYFGLYYLDPINDLFNNQYHLKPDFFAVIPRFDELLNEYPNIVSLDHEYCDKLDQILEFPKYHNDSFSYLHKNLAHKHAACNFFGVEREISMTELREKKLAMYQYFINKGEVNGYFERAQLCLYLNSQILNHGERKNICVKIEGGAENPYISYEVKNRETTIQYQEEKQDNGYIFIKNKNK